MGKVPGVSNIVMTDLRKRPEYDMIVDRGRAAFYGLNVKDVADAMHAQVHSPTYQGGLWRKGRAAIVDPARLVWGLNDQSARFFSNIGLGWRF